MHPLRPILVPGTLPASMKPFRTLLGFAFLGMAVFIMIGLSLPSQWEAEASTWIEAPPGSVYAAVAPLRAWRDWAVWFEHDPDMEVDYDGPAEGAGASYRWSGNSSVGSGEFRVVSAVPGHRIELNLSMNDGLFEAHGPIRLTPERNGTLVSWVLQGDFGSDPFGRFNRRFLEQSVAATLQESLDRLKRAVEAAPP